MGTPQGRLGLESDSTSVSSHRRSSNQWRLGLDPEIGASSTPESSHQRSWNQKFTSEIEVSPTGIGPISTPVHQSRLNGRNNQVTKPMKLGISEQVEFMVEQEVGLLADRLSISEITHKMEVVADVASRRTGGVRGRPRGCHICSQTEHTRDCSQGGGGRGCGESEHLARDCTNNYVTKVVVHVAREERRCSKEFKILEGVRNKFQYVDR